MFSYRKTGLFVHCCLSAAKVQTPVFIHSVHVIHGKVRQGIQGLFHRHPVKDQFGGTVSHALDLAVVVDHLQGLPFHLAGNVPDDISHVRILIGLPEHHILQPVVETIAFVHELGIRSPFNRPADDVPAVPGFPVSVQVDVDTLHIVQLGVIRLPVKGHLALATAGAGDFKGHFIQGIGLAAPAKNSRPGPVLFVGIDHELAGIVLMDLAPVAVSFTGPSRTGKDPPAEQAPSKDEIRHTNHLLV